MNMNFLMAITLLLIALVSLGVATLFSWNIHLTYIAGLLIWLFGIEIYYKVKCRISQMKQSQQ